MVIKQIALPKDNKFFMGYDYSNLKKQAFAVIATKPKHSSNYYDMNYRYYYNMEKLCHDVGL